MNEGKVIGDAIANAMFKTRGKMNTDKPLTVGDLLIYVNENNIPPETELCFLVSSGHYHHITFDGINNDARVWSSMFEHKIVLNTFLEDGEKFEGFCIESLKASLEGYRRSLEMGRHAYSYLLDEVNENFIRKDASEEE